MKPVRIASTSGPADDWLDPPRPRQWPATALVTLQIVLSVIFVAVVASIEIGPSDLQAEDAAADHPTPAATAAEFLHDHSRDARSAAPPERIPS